MKISESANYQTTSIAKSTAKMCINGLIISKAGIEDVSTHSPSCFIKEMGSYLETLGL
jgi:hypothetical protein